MKSWKKKWTGCSGNDQCLCWFISPTEACKVLAQWTRRPQSQYTLAVAKPVVWMLTQQTVFSFCWKHTREYSVGLTVWTPSLLAGLLFAVQHLKGSVLPSLFGCVITCFCFGKRGRAHRSFCKWLTHDT